MLGLANDDPRMGADNIFAKMEMVGQKTNFIERAFWRYAVLPYAHWKLLEDSVKLKAFLDAKSPEWGPGRVDGFNVYKLRFLHQTLASLPEKERHAAVDFTSVFQQRPRHDSDKSMKLHWDGNNDSIDERNRSAAIGDGLHEPNERDIATIARNRDFLMDLRPKQKFTSPAAPEAVRQGAALYKVNCSSCHGTKENDEYVFDGSALGTVEPIGKIKTDPGRLDSYTDAFRGQQDLLLLNTPWMEFGGLFTHFRKTNGYANAPLEAIVLRAPYLHNGSVPTLADLMKYPICAPGEASGDCMPPEKCGDDACRPQAFVRGLETLDLNKGGFDAPACNPTEPPRDGYCFDTTVPGNRNSGHLYGLKLEQKDKDAIVAFMIGF